MFRKLLFIIILKVFITQLDACVSLLINRSEINTISESFECKSSQIYFEYSEGENILMECSKNDSNASTYSYLEFDGRIEWRENRIVKNITFSEMQNNTMVECGSREFRNDSFPNQQIDLGQIQVIFRMKMANTTNMLSNLMINPTGSSTIDLMSSLAITLDTSSSNETTIENSIIYPIDRLSTTVNTVPKISHAPYTETSTLSILFDTSVDSTSTNNLSVSLPTTPSTMVDEYRYSISNNLSDTSMNIFSERTDLSSKLVTISYETTTTFLSKVSPKTARVQSPVNFTSIVPLVPSNSSTTSVISTKSNSSTASISDTTLNRNLDNESVMLSLSNIPLSANVSHDSATTPEETSNSTSFTTTAIRRKEEQPSTVYPKFLGTNAPTPSSTFTSFAVSTLPDISDSTITSLPATTLASTLANLFSTTTDINTRIETPILLPIRRTISATTDLPKLITSKRTDIIKLVSPGMENITKPVVGSSKNKLPYHKALLVVFVLIFMVLACSFVAIYRMVKQNSHKRVSSNDDVDPEIPPFPAQWYNDYVIYENGSDNNSFLTTSGKEFQEELYTKPLPKTQRVKNKDESMYANLNVSSRSQNEVLQMETMYSNISPETQRQNNPDWIYSNHETSINEPPKDVYAQIKPKRYRKQPIYANNPNHMEFVRSETSQPTERPS